MIYYLYHIYGKKIGVTTDVEERVTKQQGYKKGEYGILYSSEDIEVVSSLEIELQGKLGYKVDRDTYVELITRLTKSRSKKKESMVKNQTEVVEFSSSEATTTFPFPRENVRKEMTLLLGMNFENEHGIYEINEVLLDWIEKNVKQSMFNPAKSYIYNKTMREFLMSVGAKVPDQPEEPNVYDLIREWAEKRGIYDSGDAKTQFVKLMEEAGELSRAILKEDEPEFIDAIGDMVVVLTNLAALKGLKIEDCITSAYDVIKSRQGKMVGGTFVKEDVENTIKEQPTLKITKTL